LNLSRSCEEDIEIHIDLNNEEDENINKQVLGDKKYADGTLIKGSNNKLIKGSNNKIYVIFDNSIYHIKSLEELSKYKGPILIVSDELIASYIQVDKEPPSFLSNKQILGDKKYAD